MTKDDAFRVALETADGILNSDWRNWQELSSPEEFERWVKARANHMAIALRQAIEQAGKNQAEVQEFVAKVQEAEKEACEIINREWVGLTDEELYDLWCITKPEYEDRYGFARAIEAKLKEKNHG